MRGITAGICETSNDLNCGSDICKLLKIGLINNLIQVEARDIATNVGKFLEKD